MQKTIAVSILIAACFCSALRADDDRCRDIDSVPLCTVLADPARFDGKEITVEGLYRMVIHGSVLMEPGCRKDLVNLRGTPNEKDDKHALSILKSFYRNKKHQFEPVDEVLGGTFHVAGQNNCFGQSCLSYELEVHQLICAKVPKPKANGREASPFIDQTAPTFLR